MSNLERMKAAAKRRTVGGTAPPGPPEGQIVASGAAQGPSQAKEKPRKVPKGMVKYACGHEVGVTHLEGVSCSECAAAGRRKRREEWLARHPAEKDGRLPHRATFRAEYDAAAQQWRGVLCVDEGDCPPTEFSGTASGVERLLRDLAGQYRKWAAERGK